MSRSLFKSLVSLKFNTNEKSIFIFSLSPILPGCINDQPYVFCSRICISFCMIRTCITSVYVKLCFPWYSWTNIVLSNNSVATVSLIKLIKNWKFLIVTESGHNTCPVFKKKKEVGLPKTYYIVSRYNWTQPQKKRSPGSNVGNHHVSNKSVCLKWAQVILFQVES